MLGANLFKGVAVLAIAVIAMMFGPFVLIYLELPLVLPPINANTLIGLALFTYGASVISLFSLFSSKVRESVIPKENKTVLFILPLIVILGYIATLTTILQNGVSVAG